MPNKKWKVILPPQKAGGPYTMTIKGAKNTVTFKDVYYGEVWICSGQSNMEMAVEKCSPEDRKACVRDMSVRICTIPYSRGAPEPLEDFKKRRGWRGIQRYEAMKRSAVAYFFGHKLRVELGIPIGLILTYYGGTNAEVWTSADGIRSVPELAQANKWLKRYKSTPVGHPGEPCELFNAMVAPITPYAVRGLLWYQGEGNYPHGAKYLYRLKALYNSWRKAFENPDLKLYVIQLPPYNYGAHATYLIPELMAAQSKFAKTEKNAHLIVINDCGDLKDIHPKRKRPVGERSAMLALRNEYGRSDMPKFPEPVSAYLKKGSVIVQFNQELMTSNQKAPDWFEVAGKDGKFRTVKARLEGEKVQLSTSTISSPAQVRFGWSQLAAPNLRSKNAALPAGPFKIEIKQTLK
jgi:sialate O-acetylesterase